MPRNRASRYGRYSGGPDPLAPPVDLSEALAAIGDDVMAGYSPERALREYLRRGSSSREGLDDLARRVNARRRDLLSRYRMDGTLQQVKELLAQAVDAERKQLLRDAMMDDDDRAFRELRLDNLPPSTAAAVNELTDYDWASTEARQDYEKIKDLLGRELLDQRFAGMKQALENATDEDRAAINAMLDDLNELLDKHRRGEDTPEDFQDFMAKHGDFFPENPRNVDELIDALAQRAAAAQRLMRSMSAEQRAELMRLSAQAFGSPELMAQLDRLDSSLQALRPGEDWTGGEQFTGDEGMGLGDGTGVLQDLAELDSLAEQLGQNYSGARLDDLDLDALARQLGSDAAVNARTLAELEKALREGGFLRRDASGDLRLSPQAMRRLGKALLADAAKQLSGRQGNRETRLAGVAGEPTGASRPWQFGDSEPWDVTRTMLNAATRDPGSASTAPLRPMRIPGQARDDGLPPHVAGSVTPPRFRIQLDDVEVVETEARTSSAVALLVDASYSMAAEGRWVPMKRTALALHHLVSSRFRGDRLELISFGRWAQSREIADLTALPPVREQGTNLHHALLLANRFFRQHPSMQPVLLVVTDGEPTAHLTGGGDAWFDWPTAPETVALTVAELDKASRLGASPIFFRLGDDPGLERFLGQLARRAGGRVVAPDLADLGSAVVGEYLTARFRRGWDADDWLL
ncbi:MAG: VWA domain-containing protein [Micropruina sp.]|uniref:vWA domain-containing protein n=1 Tax=Micropruina sp. TaxID=2737536 RepID=UPI0039E540D5